jgi:MFS family permease
MGILAAVEFAPFLLLSLFAGVWVDRLPRRPILIIADIGRALLLASIPLAAVLGVLRIEQLFVVALATGVLTVFFDVADQAFLPALVSRENLVEGNSKLEVSRSVAQILGPGVAGGLVQLVTAPIAVLIDAASFIASVLFLIGIRVPEPAIERPSGPQAGVWAEIREGLGVVLSNPVLRSIAGCTATSNLFGNVMGAVFILYATRSLNLAPAELGLVFAAMGPGALLGALVANRVAQRLGLGRTLFGSTLIGGLASLLIPLASGADTRAEGPGHLLVVGLLMLANFVIGLENPIYNINQVSLRQAITPDRLQGRMNASMRFIVWGTMPIGSLLGGALGDLMGLWPTVLVGVLGGLLAPLWVLFSPVRGLRDQPTPIVEPARAG